MNNVRVALKVVSALAFAGALIGPVELAFGQTSAPPAARPATPTAPAAPATRARPATPETAPAVATGEPVARVAGRDVSAAEVREFLAGLGAEQRVAIERNPALLSEVVRQLLANQLILKEAVDKKWPDQVAIAAQLARVRESAIVELYLQAASTPPANYPDDAEIQKAYEANQSAFIVPRQFRLAQVFVTTGAGDAAATEQANKKLALVQTRLKQPKADFTALARELSDLPGAAENGGDIGWVSEADIRPEIKQQVMGLAVNTVSEPIKLSGGFHVIKLIETKASTTRPLSEVRDLLAQRLRAQRTEMLRRGYLGKVLEQNPPAINEIALVKVFESMSASQPAR